MRDIVRLALRPRVIAAAAMLAAAAAGAHAQGIRLLVGAQNGGAASDGQFFDAPITQASGYMFAAPSGDGGSIHAGPLACNTLLCDPGAVTPGAVAVASVDATQGRIRTRVRDWDSNGLISSASVAAFIEDSLFIAAPTTLTFNIRVELDELSASSTGGDTLADYSMGIRISTDPDSHIDLFSFSAIEEHDSPTHEFNIVAWGHGLEPVSFSGTPVTYEVSLPFVVDVPMTLDIEMSVFAQAEADEGLASVYSLNSGYVGIAGDYTSAGGYAWQGFAPVPEPGALVLMGLGLPLLLRRAGVWRR